MTKIRSLAADYWIDNTEKIYKENLHISTPVMEAYEAGFRKAREMAAEEFRNSTSKYQWQRIPDAMRMLADDVNNLGEEEV